MSIDFTPIVDLTLSDVDADTLVAQAVLDGLVKWPEWIPREGNTEMVLMELLAVETAETVFALNRLPAKVLEGMIRLFGIEKSLGVKATARIQITAFDLLGHLLPVGSRVQVGGIDFVTTATLTVAVGSNIGLADVEALTLGVSANQIPAGALVTLVDPVSWYQAGVSTVVSAGGREPETDAEYLLRASQRLGRVTDSLVIADHFTRYAVEQTYVGRATTIDLYDPAVGPIPGVNLGHVTVAVCTTAGTPISVANKASLSADLDARSHAGLSIHVIDATPVPITVTAVVRREPSTSASVVLSNVNAALTAFLSPSTWKWGRSVQPSEIVAVIESAAGVDFLVGALGSPLGASFLYGWQLATVGALNITIAEPV